MGSAVGSPACDNRGQKYDGAKCAGRRIATRVPNGGNFGAEQTRRELKTLPSLYVIPIPHLDFSFLFPLLFPSYPIYPILLSFLLGPLTT